MNPSSIVRDNRMTYAQARKAVEPLRSTVNEVNALRLRLEREITAPDTDPRIAEAMNDLHTAVMLALQVGLEGADAAEDGIRDRSEG